jgi:hypothetical protein
LGNQIEKNEMGGACSAYAGEERSIQGFGAETCGKEPLGRTRRRWADNIKMVLQEVGCGGMDKIELVEEGRDRWQIYVNTVMNLRVPYNVGNFLARCEPVSFSRRSLLLE